MVGAAVLGVGADLSCGGALDLTGIAELTAEPWVGICDGVTPGNVVGRLEVLGLRTVYRIRREQVTWGEGNGFKKTSEFTGAHF